MKEGIFGSVPIEQWKKSKFDMTHDVKLTGNMGQIIPVLCEEVLPGDNWRWRGNLLIRFAPLLAPVMHRVKATMHAFHVANRTLNTNWKEAITGGDQGVSTETVSWVDIGDLCAHVVGSGPTTFRRLLQRSSLWDHLGLPEMPYDVTPGVYTDHTRINILPFLAYTQIWQYFYRDQNIDSDDTMVGPVVGGEMAPATFVPNFCTLRTRAWQKDPFTSALPWPQRGPEVLLPVSGVATGADIVYLANSQAFDSGTNAAIPVGAALGSDGTAGTNLQAGIPQVVGPNAPITIGTDARIENIDSITFQNNSITINDFRTAVVVQKWLELNARGGARYNEFVLQQFSTIVPDFRIDQPEYIGGGTQYVNFSEVLTTANSLDFDSNTIPPATMTGHGISTGRSNTFDYAVKEHGWIMVLLSVMPETNYQQGVPRKFTRVDRLDWAFPVFAGLGEQEVLSREIFFDPRDPGSSGGNDELFGYNQRFWEYKHIQNSTRGEFKQELSYWTMTRIFNARPNPIDTGFVYADPTHRIFAVQDGGDTDKLWMQVVHELSVLRPLPYFSVPGIVKI